MPNKQFLNRMRQGLRPDSTSLVRYIAEETYINMRPFSFVGHEYQRYITELIEHDPEIDLSIEKPSQIGLSEIIYRIILSLMALTPGYSVGLLMPSVRFSSEVLKTRIDPIIDTSEVFRKLINTNVDSSAVKMFLNTSILFALGASPNSKTTLINRPIRFAVTDEIDRCSYDVHTGLRSRQTHSAHKPRLCLSTPTFPGVGINAEAIGRQVHQQIIICHSCKHEYFPDYYSQTAIPGFDEPVVSLTADKVNERGLVIDDAYHFCPNCHTKSILTPEYRQWTVTDSHLRKIHVKLTPYDAPQFISTPDLVTSQLTFSSSGEFRNQALGLTTELKDATVDVSKVQFTHDEAPTGVRISGLDFGGLSHYMSGIITENQIIVDKIEILEIPQLQENVVNLVQMDNVSSICADSLPFLDVTHKLSGLIPQYWPAIYTVPTNPKPELFTLKSNDEERVRQINIQKNIFFDTVASMLMTGQIIFRHGPYDGVLLEHLQSMRRVRDYRYVDIRYQWIKAAVATGKGKSHDHLWHALIYLVAASKIVGQSKFQYGLLPTESLFSSFRTKIDV